MSENAPSVPLARLISLANELPQNLPPLEILWNEAAEDEEQWIAVTRRIWELLIDAPNCLAYVNGQSPYDDSVLPNQPRRYQDLRMTVGKLRIIAATTSGTLRGPSHLRELLNTELLFDVEGGKVQFTAQGLYWIALSGAEIDRIRLCPICDIVYFASRIDKMACSPDCSNKYRQRRFYKRITPEQRNKANAQRRANYEYKKDQELRRLTS